MSLRSHKCVIFYGDGSIYEGEPEGAPKLNVQCVVAEDTSLPMWQVGRICLHYWDYYVWSGQHWYGVNGETDLVDHLLHAMPKVILKGRYIEPARFQQILAEAQALKKSDSEHTWEDGRQRKS